MSVNLNADLGESYGRWTLGDGAAVMPHLTSANVACGFHGGDPHSTAAESAAARLGDVRAEVAATRARFA